ncbi:MAG: PAAR domain-containing protein [Ewingella sp.]|uniref:PAAR domain-containing protein n=1 Tax=Ewingella TaxID=41201 RepID=UPI00336551B0
MARGLACLGDKTSFGAVVSATATWFEGDKPIARTGDKATCSKCDGVFEIFASAQDWAEEGKAYVATGDRVLCNCPDHYVFGSTSQYTSTPVGVLTSRNTHQSSVSTQQVKDSTSRNSLRFQCCGDNGQLMACCRYTVIFPDGRSETGMTDEKGMTAWHFSESVENINLHILMD